MTFYAMLILIFVLFFCVSFWLVLKTQDALFTVFYAFLFIYTVFTQIGYVFYPNIAIDMRVYFGIDIFYSYWLFVFFSFVTTVVLFFIVRLVRMRHQITQLSANFVIKLPKQVFLFITGSYVIALSIIFLLNYEEIRYANVGNKWVSFMINSQPIIILTLYMKFRRFAHDYEKTASAIILSVAVILFMLISLRAGQRLVGLSLLVGMLTFEFSPFKDILKKHSTRLLVMASIVFFFLFFAGRIVDLRNKYNGSVPIEALSEIFVFEQSKAPFDFESILRLDYFAPSSLIFVSMAHNWIKPEEVFRSNVYNYVVFTDYPYLQNILSEVANPVSSFSRSESYGYYILTEGFNFAGWLGIFYNAVMINVGLGLWRLFASTRDKSFNTCMTAVLAILVVSLVRAPSVHFVRTIYLSIIPAAVLISLAIGYIPIYISYNRHYIHGHHGRVASRNTYLPSDGLLRKQSFQAPLLKNIHDKSAFHRKTA